MVLILTSLKLDGHVGVKTAKNLLHSSKVTLLSENYLIVRNTEGHEGVGGEVLKEMKDKKSTRRTFLPCEIV